MGNKNLGTATIGTILVGIGIVLTLRQMGYPVPGWVFGWQMILIIVGLFVGIQTRFRDLGWLIMILIGSVFILREMFPHLPIRNYLWPTLFLMAGAVVLLRPYFRRPKQAQILPGRGEAAPLTNYSQLLDTAAVFGGVKQNIVSKDFRGGEVVCVFGGAEINLTQADFSEIIELEVVCVFGGLKLIIPANWKIRSEAAAVFGGIEDKRPQSLDTEFERTLILKGTVIFGGIDIRSF